MAKYILTGLVFFIAQFVCAQAPKTFNGTGGTIPDDGPLKCFTTNVTGVGIINDTYGVASVCLNITHDWDADLEIYLKAPDGTITALSIQNGGNGNNYTNTCFSFTATTPISAGTAPFRGTYKPDDNLGSVNNGQNADGVWSLCIQDMAEDETGRLLNWSILFNSTPAPRYPPPTAQDCPAAISICQNAYDQVVSYAGAGNYGNEINSNTSCLAGGEVADVWYTFTVQNSGDLSFRLTPNNRNEDYDWAVYNLTNATCADIYNNPAINVSCNFSSDAGTTGPTGGSRFNSQDAEGSAFNARIPVLAGETYVINVSNYAESVNGYKIDFSASSAKIFDNTPPALKSVNPKSACGGNSVAVNFTENISCANMNPADFTVTGPDGAHSVTSVTSESCASGAIYGNNLVLTVNPPITTNGSYDVCLTGTSIADNCGNTATPSCLSFTVSSTAPTFNISPLTICQGGTAPTLPTTSSNGFTGTWSPAVVSNTADGTYNFTANAGQCALPYSVDIKVTSSITPLFDPIAPFCSGSVAPTLPTTSTNGIAGTWSPSTINNTTGGTYTFTPNSGQCAVSTTMKVDVTTKTATAFSPIGPICSGSVAPPLPTTSTNGITGTWAPSTINNTADGTYTFTPDAGQCATTFLMTVNITTANITPAFTAIGPICKGSVAPTLPTTSINGITGSWSPSTINNSADGTYTFTPDPGQCATSFPMTVSVTTNITPLFAAIGPICNGSVAPPLPTTSTNGITGSWSPSTINNTADGTYTFTPDPGQCAVSVPLSVTITTGITPAFTAIGPICNGTVAPPLPTTSTNGITGTWSPSTINNTADGTYTFTPDPGQCAVSTTLSVTIASAGITPTFIAIAPFCNGTTAPTLPRTSTNGITGTWSPSTINNTADGTYTFTPDPGQCAVSTTLPVTVTSASITPTFNAIAPFCSGSVAPTLPRTSINGITGTWSPATIDNVNGGVYTFTPNPGQCAVSTTLTVSTIPVVIPVFATIAPICSGSTAPILPTTSTNGITGTWSPSIINNTNGGDYTFIADVAPGQCPSSIKITVTILPVKRTPVPVNVCSTDLPFIWNGQPYTTAGPHSITLRSADGCDSIVTLSLNINSPLSAPFVKSSVGYCQGVQAGALTATATNQLRWYTQPTGGVASNIAPVPSTSSEGSTDYYVSQANASCESSREKITVTITRKPILGENKELIICSGASGDVTTLFNTTGLENTWSLNIGEPVADPTAVRKAGNYKLISRYSGGNCSDTAIVKLIVRPPVIANAGKDGNAEINIPYQLNGSGGKTYEWSPATLLNDPHIQNPKAIITNDTYFTLRVEDAAGCSDTDVVKIRILKGPDFYMPTAFTPNGDGLNDLFIPQPVGIKSLEYFRIYNRLGELLFESKDLTKGWDGTYKGQKQDAANYVWTLQGIDRTGIVRSLKGYVVLVR